MSGEMSLNLLNGSLISPSFRLKNDKRSRQLEDSRSTGAPLALREDDTLLPPERPLSGPEIDDIDPEKKRSGGTEADDMEPPRTKPRNSYPGVDDGLIPKDDDDFPSPLEPVFPLSPVDFDKPPLPDVNVYQQKKTLAQGMMDLALLTANANQLRYVLDAGSEYDYFYVNMTFILISVLLQVGVGILLLWNSRFNIHKEHHIVRANRINNFTVIGIFLITILNVFISAFGLPTRSEVEAGYKKQNLVESTSNITQLDLLD